MVYLRWCQGYIIQQILIFAWSGLIWLNKKYQNGTWQISNDVGCGYIIRTNSDIGSILSNSTGAPWNFDTSTYLVDDSVCLASSSLSLPLSLSLSCSSSSSLSSKAAQLNSVWSAVYPFEETPLGTKGFFDKTTEVQFKGTSIYHGCLSLLLSSSYRHLNLHPRFQHHSHCQYCHDCHLMQAPPPQRVQLISLLIYTCQSSKLS